MVVCKENEMKIGILQCDDVMDELQGEFGNYPLMFEKLLTAVSSDIDYVIYRCIDGELPQSIDDCEAYITTGSRHSVNDNFTWIVQLEAFILKLIKAKKKFVGICFGHQLFAKALGGKVETSERGWGVGISFNEVTSQKNWMQPFQPGLDLVVSHQEQITELPERVEVLGSSDFCPYYLLQYDDHVMTVQGHPEFSKAYSNALMDKRLDRIPANRVREGRISLSASVDDLLMIQWVVNFMRQ
jgi:GMP synthase-like glutamine amidotransferase